MSTLARVLIAIVIAVVVIWLGSYIMPYFIAVGLGIVAGLIFFAASREAY